MAYTSTQISDLNGSMEASRLFGQGLGTELNEISGSISDLSGVANVLTGVHTVTLAEANASLIELEIGSTISGWIVQINRSGSTVTYDAKVTTASGSVLQIEDGAATYVTAEDDEITYLVI